MKKLMFVAAIAAMASGCVFTSAKVTAESGLTLDVSTPDTVFIDNSVKPVKCGTATAQGIICFVQGDASLKKAMDNGGITKIHHVDYKVNNILGIVGSLTTVVWGE